MMRSIFQPGYGPPEILELREDVAVPSVADDAVLVQVRAASVNALDWRTMRAKPFFVRLTNGLRKPKSGLMGVDAAGIVEKVGRDVTHLEPGDEVYGTRTGAFAEYVSGRTFVPKPTRLSFEEAAALPVAGVTALQGLRDHGQLQAGQRVLVNGAGGGVGTFAVQIAKAMGAEVTAVSKGQNSDLMRSLGADHFIDHTRQDFTTNRQKYDLVADVGGNRPIAALRRIVAPGGNIVILGAGHGRGGPLANVAAAFVRSRLLRQRVGFFIANVTKEDLLTLNAMVESGKLTPVIDTVYPLTETAAAIRHLEEGRARGKVVITI
jgi:NADPH:quinone reductase-like Zn-dependent oxidoreductase